jgi:hypothetical protein
MPRVLVFLPIVLIIKGFRTPYKYIAVRERAPGFILVRGVYIGGLDDLHIIGGLNLKSDLESINLCMQEFHLLITNLLKSVRGTALIL